MGSYDADGHINRKNVARPAHPILGSAHHLHAVPGELTDFAWIRIRNGRALPIRLGLPRRTYSLRYYLRACYHSVVSNAAHRRPT